MNHDDRDKWGAQWPGGGTPEADWERRIVKMREQAARDQQDAARQRAEQATTAPSPSRKPQDERTPVLSADVPLPPVSDAVGRSLLARWRRHR
jgi:hypothetical protein